MDDTDSNVIENAESSDDRAISSNSYSTSVENASNEEASFTSSCEVMKMDENVLLFEDINPYPCEQKKIESENPDESVSNSDNKQDSVESLRSKDESVAGNSKRSTNIGQRSGEKSKKHKKKHRAGRPERHKKRRYKPYLRLSWIEQQKLEERVSRRAQRVRDEMVAHGLPLAPYNTTQFIISDHNIEEPDYEKIQRDTSSRKYNYDDSPELNQSMTEDEEWVNEQFSEVYENLRAEYLENLSKVDLADQLLNLEDQVEDAEKQLKDVREHKLSMGLDDKDPDAEITKINVFREEIYKLMMENDSLCRKNIELRDLLSSDSSE